jgi:hypothetical protein
VIACFSANEKNVGKLLKKLVGVTGSDVPSKHGRLQNRPQWCRRKDRKRVEVIEKNGRGEWI